MRGNLKQLARIDLYIKRGNGAGQNLSKQDKNMQLYCLLLGYVEVLVCNVRILLYSLPEPTAHVS